MTPTAPYGQIMMSPEQMQAFQQMLMMNNNMPNNMGLAPLPISNAPTPFTPISRKPSQVQETPLVEGSETKIDNKKHLVLDGAFVNQETLRKIAVDLHIQPSKSMEATFASIVQVRTINEVWKGNEPFLDDYKRDHIQEMPTLVEKSLLMFIWMNGKCQKERSWEMLDYWFLLHGSLP